MEKLEGGRHDISKVGECVRRPAGPWTPEVHRLLRHLREVGFAAAPEPHGFAADGYELVSYLPGRIAPSEPSLQTLTSAARLLRAYHDASASFVASASAWQLPARQPPEVICHGDYAPYNVVLDGERAVGLIDFDVAHPGPRRWDIAYALYRWAPLTGEPGDEQIERARIFCDAYGLDERERRGMAALVVERLRALISFMAQEARRGDAKFQADCEQGHLELYLADSERIAASAAAIDAGLRPAPP